MNVKPLIITSLLSFTTFNVYAETPRVIVAPNCLIKTMPQSAKILAKHQEFTLLEMEKSAVSLLAYAKHQQNCGGFVDATLAWSDYATKHVEVRNKAVEFLAKFVEEPKKPLKKSLQKAYEVKYPEKVKALIGSLQPETMWQNLTTLTNFPDRYADSDHGVEAANWIKDSVENFAKSANRQDVSVTFVNTGSYKQPSVVAKLGTGDDPGIVIGAHMDTLSGRWINDQDTSDQEQFLNKKPGADDDGSGTVTVLETVRTILNSGMTFKKPIYFIWYAAEELGLIGSSYVVRDFRDKAIKVDSVLQFDMTGYTRHNNKTMWLMDDHVNKDLTSFLEKLITTYVERPVKHTRCGYACSDHASWNRYGYAAAMPFETEMGEDNPYIHTTNDRMEHLSLEHMTDYAKLAIAYLVELAEPII